MEAIARERTRTSSSSSSETEQIQFPSSLTNSNDIEELPEVWDVDGLDPDEAFTWASRYNIPDDIEDAKMLNRCLKLAITRQRLAHFKYNTMSDEDFNIVIERQKSEDCKRRQYLLELLDKTIELAKIIDTKIIEKFYVELGKIEKEPDPLQRLIAAQIPDFANNLMKLKNLPNGNEEYCSILISGESGSGKSSFINLLLKCKVLPYSLMSSTSTFVRIRYSQQRYATIHNFDDEIIEHIDGSDETFFDRLKPYISDTENREMKCSYCTLYCNSPILKNGVELIDSMGFGDTEEFNVKLKEFHKNACGFIYLLKRNNPLGDHRSGLMHYVKNLCDDGTMRHHGSVLFIINMWDDLELQTNERAEKERIYNNIIDTLSKFWPLQSPQEQVIRISVLDSWFMQENGVTSESLSLVLESIQRLCVHSLHTDTLNLFSGLNNFVSVALECIQSMYRYNETDTNSSALTFNRQAELNNINICIKDLQERINIFVKKQEKEIKDTIKRSAKLIIEHLKSQEVKSRLVHQMLQRCKDGGQIRTTSMQIKEINKDIKDLAIEEVENIISTFESKTRLFYNARKDLITKFTESFQGFECDLIGLEEKLMPKLNEIGFLGDYVDFQGMNTAQKIIMGVLSPVLIPIIIGALIIRLPLIAYKHLFDQNDLDDYYNNKSQYIQKLSSDVLQKYSDNKSEINKYVQMQMKQVTDCLEVYKKKVQERIETLRSRVDVLKEGRNNLREFLQEYNEYRGILRELHHNLRRFKQFYMETDHRDIQINDVHTEINSQGKSTILCRGWVSYIVKGNQNAPQFKCRATNQGVSIMKFYKEEDYRNYLKIVRKLARDRSNGNYADFIVQKKHSVIYPVGQLTMEPLIVIESIQCSLYNLIRQKHRSFRKITSITQQDREKYQFLQLIFQQITSGLHFLHSRRLVHKSICLESIAVTTDGKIKLTNMSSFCYIQAKWNEISTVEDVVKYRLFSPECLLPPPNQDIYCDRSEIYTLGIVMYEAWTGVKAFESEILDRTNPISSLELLSKRILTKELSLSIALFYRNNHKFRSHYAENYFTIIECCIQIDKKLRPTAETIQLYISNRLDFD